MAGADDPVVEVAKSADPPEFSLKEVKGLNDREFQLSKPARLREVQRLTD